MNQQIFSRLWWRNQFQPSLVRLHRIRAKPIQWGLLGLGLFVLFCYAGFAARPVQAAFTPQVVQQTEDARAPIQPVDVIVLLDDSGSMATCWPWPQEGLPFEPPCGAPSENPPSDPDELRYSAARLLLQLADAEDRMAVLRFDSIAEGVGALGSLQQVGNANNRQALGDSLQAPGDYLRRGYTRIDLGLEQAISLLREAREPGRTQYILLLTDGDPTAPGNVPNQDSLIADQLNTLRQEEVMIFPVILCNANSGCADEFLSEQLGDAINQANTAQDLLRVFSDILTRMKPDRSLITNRNPAGALQFTTRQPHGVQRVALVTPRDGLVALRRDENPLLTSNTLNDPNIALNVFNADNYVEGNWVAETVDNSSFAIVQAASYPQLLSPPPSLAESPASARYYPAGKPPLLIARANGPGASEPLYLNGDTLMEPFGQDNTRAIQLEEEPDRVTLQLGDDAQPLRLRRSFQLTPRSDLPQAQVFAPTADNSGLLEDGRARLQVGFGGGATVEELAATIYILEETADGSLPLVYQGNMTCNERLCTDEGFTPEDGRSYQIYYVVEGQVDALRFSDWSQASLVLEPAVYLQGLPPSLDLAQMPDEGWAVELGSGTLEDIGTLSAVLELRNTETDEVVESVGLDFAEDVPEEGSTQTALRVSGLDNLRPGVYEGAIRLSATTPAGRPMDVKIRPAESIPVGIRVERPVARIETQAVDFGEVLFDTSPNFRLDQESLLPIVFEGRPFKLTASQQETSCDNVSLVAQDVVTEEGRTFLPLHLSSVGPVMPTTCQGTIVLSGPNEDYDVTPNRLDWQTRVASVEWSIVSGDLHLPDFQDAGTRVQETLLIRFNGKTPFVLQLQDVSAAGSTGGEDAGAPVRLGEDQLDMPSVEVTGPPNEAGLYEVPINFVARQEIPGDELRGTYYSGQLALGIAGLPNDIKSVDFNFRSPSLYQRYLAPIVVPVYSMPWVLCTGPLTLLVMLVMVARLRSRGFDEHELEEAALAATRQMRAGSDNLSEPEPLPLAADSSGVNAERAWGSTEWSSIWHDSGKPLTTGQHANGAVINGNQGNGAQPNGGHTKPSGDPWSSSW